MPNRRRILQMLGAATALGAGGWALLSGTRGNAYYQGPLSDHFDGVRFFNPDGVGPRGPSALLKWQFGERSESWPTSYPSPFPQDHPPPRFEGNGARIVFIGHASFLIQTRGLNLLIDPVWAERVSPLSFIGPKRVNAPGVAFEDLPKIDAVLVTHNHYDHMDTDVVGRLWQRFQPRIITPLGNDAILRQAAPGLVATGMDWDQVIDLGGGVRVHAEPTAHWSARGMGDRMHALWASFMLETGDRKIFCVGDTGFNGGGTFRRAKQRHPEIALAFLPIGAYEPRWFMSNIHMNPEEALEAMGIIGARQAFGHHWGTFHLTNEGVDRPHEALTAALLKKGVPADRFPALRPGEVRMLA